MHVRQTDLRIDTAGVLDADPTWSWDMDGFAGGQFVFWVIADGRGSLRAGDDTYELGRGDCFISPMSAPHHGRQQPDALLGIPWLVFRYIDPNTGQPVLPTPMPKRHRKLKYVDIVEYLTRRAVEAFRGGEARHWEAAHLLKTVLIEVAYLDTMPEPATGDAAQRRQVAELAEMVRRAPGEAHTLESLAARAHYSPDHLVRLFKRHFGVTPGEFVIRCRIEEAQRLLLFTGQSVGAIAARLGYSDAGYFSRQFTARVGLPPSSYRKTPGGLLN